MRATAASHSFHNAVLGVGTTIKVKGLQIQRKPSEPLNKSFWINWDWNGYIRPQIERAKSLGANLVRIPGCTAGVIQGGQSRADFQGKVRQILDYTANINLMVYWTSHFPFAGDDLNATDAPTVAEIVSMMALVGRYKHVIGNDCSNEAVWNLGQTVALANQQVWYPQIKAVAPNLPLSVSVLCQSAPDLAGPGVSAFASYVDFYDLHPYFSGSNAVNSDFNTLRAAAYFKPFFLGECGLPLSAGLATQTSRIQSLGAIASVASDCLGSMAYTIVDTTTGTGDYGFYSNDGLFTERTQLTTPFKAWPSSY